MSYCVRGNTKQPEAKKLSQVSGHDRNEDGTDEGANNDQGGENRRAPEDFQSRVQVAFLLL